MAPITPSPICGLHHVTALSKDAARTRAFYEDLLGLRLVKRTVNFDDPSVYHLYFGDAVGTPGTVLTFFPYPHIAPGRHGTREICECALAVPAGSLDAWAARLEAKETVTDRVAIMGESRLAFRDPDGMPLSLVETAHTELDFRYWTSGPLPPQMAITRLHSVSLCMPDADPTARLLTGRLGFRPAGAEGARRRFHVAEGGPGRQIDLITRPDADWARPGAGAIHHVALRVVGEEEQRFVRQEIATAGLSVTHALDRTYFRSIYFREPGGVIFEVATDGPGFTADEPEDELGSELKLPTQHEHLRERLDAELPPLR